MTIVDAITESGTVYRIDKNNSFWIRFPHAASHTYALGFLTERIWALKVGTKLNLPWENEVDWQDADAPEVGKHLYIAGKETWFVSKKVVKIVEVDDWKAPASTLEDAQ